MPEKPPFVETLTGALKSNLANAGVKCQVKVEPVPGTKMYRFFVIAKQFKAMQYSERQSVVWRVLDRALSPEEAGKVSMIMTLTPTEFGEAKVP